MTPACCRIPKAAIPALLLLTLTLGVQAQYVLDSIDVGGRFVGSLCYNSRSDVVYGNSESGGFFFAIDCSTNEVISSISLRYPLRVVYNATGNKAYCSYYNYELDSVLVVDGSTHQRIKAIPLDALAARYASAA